MPITTVIISEINVVVVPCSCECGHDDLDLQAGYGDRQQPHAVRRDRRLAYARHEEADDDVGKQEGELHQEGNAIGQPVRRRRQHRETAGTAG